MLAKLAKAWIFIGSLFIFGLALGFSPGGAGNLDIRPTDVIHWQVAGGESDGLNVTIGLRLTTEQNFTLYVNKVKFVGPPGTTLTKLDGPPSFTIKDPVMGEEVAVYAAGDFMLHFNSLEPMANKKFELAITFLGCTQSICLFPYTQQLTIDVFPAAVALASATSASATSASATSASATSASATSASATSTTATATTATATTATQAPTTATAASAISAPASQTSATATTLSTSSPGFEHQLASQVAGGQLSLSLLLLVLFVGGLATNLTPCVFPMIPITLRILGRQGSSRWISSLCYALGIVLTYTTLGAVSSFTGSMFGGFSGGVVFNIAFATIFAVLGLTMLGFGNLSNLQNLGARFGSGKSSPFNTFLMGAGAGLVAAPCTGPILGGLLAYTAKATSPAESLALFFCYSVGFALPYVFLGTFAGSVSKIKVSAQVQIGVKLGFAAIMFALAFYYLRIPLRQIIEPLNGHWWLTAIVFGGFGLVLSGYFLIRAIESKAQAILPSLILAVGVFAATQTVGGLDKPIHDKIAWHKSFEAGLLEAQKSNKPLLVDGWAEWCAACKEMDVTTYQDPDVKRVIGTDWVAVKIDFTEPSDELDQFAERFEMKGLPVTILLPPSGDLTKKRRITGYIPRDGLLSELQAYRTK